MVRKYRNTLGAHDDGYNMLGCAVVEQAVEDYKAACLLVMPCSRKRAKKPFEDFFLSQWCYNLCGVNQSVWRQFIEECSKIEPADVQVENVEYHEYLQVLMKIYGIKQANIIRGTGIHRATISEYANGRKAPSIKNRLLIKKYFKKLEDGQKE